MNRVSIATELKLKPFTKTVLSHLRRRGSLTPLEAMISYGSARIAPQIHELREAGYEITTELRRDEAGHKYARYSMVGRVN